MGIYVRFVNDAKVIVLVENTRRWTFQGLTYDDKSYVGKVNGDIRTEYKTNETKIKFTMYSRRKLLAVCLVSPVYL